MIFKNVAFVRLFLLLCYFKYIGYIINTPTSIVQYQMTYFITKVRGIIFVRI